MDSSPISLIGFRALRSTKTRLERFPSSDGMLITNRREFLSRSSAALVGLGMGAASGALAAPRPSEPSAYWSVMLRQVQREPIPTSGATGGRRTNLMPLLPIQAIIAGISTRWRKSAAHL